jgi:hypothetical protein
MTSRQCACRLSAERSLLPCFDRQLTGRSSAASKRTAELSGLSFFCANSELVHTRPARVPARYELASDGDVDQAVRAFILVALPPAAQGL